MLDQVASQLRTGRDDRIEETSLVGCLERTAEDPSGHGVASSHRVGGQEQLAHQRVPRPRVTQRRRLQVLLRGVMIAGGKGDLASSRLRGAAASLRASSTGERRSASDRRSSPSSLSFRASSSDLVPARTGLAAGKNRKLQDRSAAGTPDIGHGDKTGQAKNDRDVYRARLPRGTEPEAAGR